MEFREFGKIPRLSRECVITEKIDGTNASIYIEQCADPAEHFGELEPGWLYSAGGTRMRFGSRTRWITPDNDNFGFAAWGYDHADELAALGPGHHFGEWWGKGIQRNYDQDTRHFSLFNTGRWAPTEFAIKHEKQSVPPACCRVVPVMYRGVFDTALCSSLLGILSEGGSRAAPGFKPAEGIIVYHEAAGQYFKKTIEKDEGKR